MLRDRAGIMTQPCLYSDLRIFRNHGKEKMHSISILLMTSIRIAKYIYFYLALSSECWQSKSMIQVASSNQLYVISG